MDNRSARAVTRSGYLFGLFVIGSSIGVVAAMIYEMMGRSEDLARPSEDNHRLYSSSLSDIR